MSDHRPAGGPAPDGDRPPLPRAASAALAASLAALPVTVLMGARQTGKSTLVQTSPNLSERPYLTLDDLDVRIDAKERPDDLLSRSSSLTLDEVQRDPELMLAVKRAVDGDRPRRPGRFVLTGSANLLLMRRISESLAGRAGYVTLWPMVRGELQGHGRAGAWGELLSSPVDAWPALLKARDSSPADWRELARVGGYPTPAYELDSDAARSVWFRGFVQTWLERDLQDLAAIDNLADFRRLMRAASLRIGGLLNQTEVARDVGLSRPTAHRYLNLLEAAFQLVRIEPYSVNRTKRLIKSPKSYWGDVGLALHLAGEEPRGAHLENLVLLDLLVWRDSAPHLAAEVLYWRTTTGDEVDFVVEQGDKLLAIEIKAADRPRSADARHLRTFAEQYPDKLHGALVLHDGDEITWLGKGILAVPWWRVI